MHHTEAAKLMAAHKWRWTGYLDNDTDDQCWERDLPGAAGHPGPIRCRAERSASTGHVIITVICKTADELDIVLDELGA